MSGIIYCGIRCRPSRHHVSYVVITSCNRGGGSFRTKICQIRRACIPHLWPPRRENFEALSLADNLRCPNFRPYQHQWHTIYISLCCIHWLEPQPIFISYHQQPQPRTCRDDYRCFALDARFAPPPNVRNHPDLRRSIYLHMTAACLEFLSRAPLD